MNGNKPLIIICAFSIVAVGIALSVLLYMRYGEQVLGTDTREQLSPYIGESLSKRPTVEDVTTTDVANAVGGARSVPSEEMSSKPEDLYGAADGSTQKNLGQDNFRDDADEANASIQDQESPSIPKRPKGKLSIGLPSRIITRCALPDNLALAIQTDLQGNFVRSGKYKVVEVDEEAQEALSAEMSRSSENMLQGGDAAVLNQLSAIRFLVLSSVTGFTVDPGASVNSDEGSNTLRAELFLSVKLVDTSTHHVVEQREVSVTAIEFLPVTLRARTFRSVTIAKKSPERFSLFKMRKVEGLTQSEINAQIDKYTKKIVNNLANRAADRMSQVINDSLYPIKVIAMMDGLPVLNSGKDNHLNKGDLLEVFAIKRVTDPDTGEVLNLGRTIGVIRVRDLMNKTATCEILSGLGIKAGAQARRISEAEYNAHHTNTQKSEEDSSNTSVDGIRAVKEKEVSDW